MFKKRCNRCNEKVDKSFDFCPHCGSNLKSKNNQEDYGMLGKNDFVGQGFPGLGDSFMDKLFNNAMKMLERQMRSLPRDFDNPEKMPNVPDNLKVQFFVNGKRITPGKMPVRKVRPKTKNIRPIGFSPEKKEKFALLPKIEPLSKVRRLGGKVVYEFEMPDVKNIEDVLINQLETSIEIKAIGKNKGYYKTLNINLPILRYQLAENNLVLELKTEGH